MSSLADSMTWDVWLFTFFNAVIVGVYFVVALIVVPVVARSITTCRISALVFCCFTGATYIDQILRTILTPGDTWMHTVHAPHMLIIRGGQAISLSVFAIAQTMFQVKVNRAAREQVRSALDEAKGILESIDVVGT